MHDSKRITYFRRAIVLTITLPECGGATAPSTASEGGSASDGASQPAPQPAFSDAGIALPGRQDASARAYCDWDPVESILACPSVRSFSGSGCLDFWIGSAEQCLTGCGSPVVATGRCCGNRTLRCDAQGVTNTGGQVICTCQ